MKNRLKILNELLDAKVISYNDLHVIISKTNLDKLYYNLSEEEIQALMNEIKDEANGNVVLTSNGSGTAPSLLPFPGLDQNYVPERNGYVDGSPPVCFHKWKSYTGLNEMFDFCTECGDKKK